MLLWEFMKRSAYHEIIVLYVFALSSTIRFRLCEIFENGTLLQVWIFFTNTLESFARNLSRYCDTKSCKVHIIRLLHEFFKNQMTETLHLLKLQFYVGNINYRLYQYQLSITTSNYKWKTELSLYKA